MKRLFFAIFLALSSLPLLASAQNVVSTDGTLIYSKMNADEKRRFIAAKSEEILVLFGRTKGDGVNPEGVRAIQFQLDGYARRLTVAKRDTCDAKQWLRSDLASVILRGRKSAAVINEEFSAKKLPSQIGLYTAMIESEFCPCLQSPIGALGMFQFTASFGDDYGLATKKNASPTNPDDRCRPKLAARAAAAYYRAIIDKWFESDAIGLPLAISSFNRGEGNTKRHLADVAAFWETPRISFWFLLETADELRVKLEKGSDSKSDNHVDGDKESAELPRYFQQFEEENIKYVPKFFAAAIIGENPKSFGIDTMPLSQIK